MPRQEELYGALAADVDPELSWAEHELPERERTKHVHRLHPYLGKFVPQLVEIFLRRSFPRGAHILDPFAGSGTTLVECSTYGTPSTGVDISAFNALLCRVKTTRVNPFVAEHDLRDALARLEAAIACGATAPAAAGATPFLRTWYDERALGELLLFRSLVDDYPESADLLRVLLSRSARSARLTTHFDLDFPRTPQREPYHCHKHRRVCTPTREAAKFLRRYTLDTIRRVKEYERLRSDAPVTVHHADARVVAYGARFDGLITSPPYPGRIDYHEQHRYAFELLGLGGREADEIGSADKGATRAAVRAYVDDMVAVFSHARAHLRPGADVVIVVDDARQLYDEVLDASELRLVERRTRHVNRRTGRRAGEFFEQILVARV